MTTGTQDEAIRKRRSAHVLVSILGVIAAAVSVSAQASQITTFAADCTTPKSTFNLGETICAIATGLQGFRLQIVDPDGFVVSSTDITADPQTTTFVLPTTDQSSIGGLFTANNLGRWRTNAVTPASAVNADAFVTVKDPDNPKVDLSIVKSYVGSAIPNPGDPVQYAVRIVNNGPDAAANVHFVDNVFSNLIFDSLTQTSGSAFTCTGTSGADCVIASLPNGAVAEFLLNFKAGTAGGNLQNTATVSSDTPELNPLDNSAGSPGITVAGTGTPPTCNISITAPSAVTLFTGPGATSCGVVVTDLDATLGTATATDNCEIDDVIVRMGVPAGNNFPVGTTTVTYSITDSLENTATAIQEVTVVDNTLPTITCPGNLTLEPTCPAGAVATWTAPVGTDNCPNATTAQTGGPLPGSVFPIGTTSVAYTVTDASGNQASCSFTVTVLTVSQTIQNLETSVNGSSLNPPKKQGLIPKLDAALAAFTRGNINAACGPLDAFVKLVQNYIADGTISAAQGQAWIASATHVENAIGCTNNPCS